MSLLECQRRVCGTQKGNSQSKLTSARNLIVPSEIWEELKLTAIKRDFSSRFSLKKRGKWWQQRSGLAFGKDYTRHALARNAEKLKARILCLAATEPLIWRSFMTTVEFCGCGESISRPLLTFLSFTSSPTASMTPEPSIPIVTGGEGSSSYSPCLASSSAKFSPHALTRTRTSPAFSFGLAIVFTCSLTLS